MRIPALAILAAGLGGCAGTKGVSQYRGMTLHDNVTYIRGVAPVMQDKQVQCGPACLASVAAYWDHPVSESGLRTCLGETADARAHSGEQLAKAAKLMGLQAFVYQGGLDDLDRNLGQGRPVIVLLRRRPLGELGELGLGGMPAERVAADLTPKLHHWVVVVGSDKETVIVHDPAMGPVRLSRAVFDGWWSKMARVSLLVVPRETAAVSGN